MSAAPTRRQWRGLAVLCLVLAALLALLFLRPASVQQPRSDDHSRLKAAIDSFGDSLVTAKAASRKQYRTYRRSDTTAHRSDDRRQAMAAQLAAHREEYYRSIKVELNSADTAELQRLYGIGPAFAARIVRYRDRLGGYVRKEQLLEVYGMDSGRYDGIAGNVYVDTSLAVKIDINKATVDELKRHPYIDYYQARAIVDFRRKGYSFGKPDDLLLVSLIDEATVIKLQGYIQF